MLTVDGLVMIIVDDEDWHVDRLELSITPIWLLGHILLIWSTKLS
jgi:hypothetical protein